MKKITGLLTLLLFLPLCTRVSAQNIGRDLERMVHHTKSARAFGQARGNTSLDTIVMTLAYYGGMPDAERINELLSGPELLSHYAGNPPIRNYFLDEGLDSMLQFYTPPAGLAVPAEIAAPERAKFLQKISGSELFSTDGLIDLRKIHETYAVTPPDDISLKAAAATAANSSPGNLTSANLVGNALAGLSDWISRRAQEELTYTFLTQLRDDLERNDLNYLFPKTTDFLPTLDLLNYKAILPSIRKAFVEDLNALAFNLGNYLDNRNAETFRTPVIYNVFLIYRILDLQMREVSLADILAYTYGELERTQLDTRRLIDLRMADVDTTNKDYRAIQRAFDRLIMATDTLNERFQLARDNLSDQQFNPILTKLQVGELPPADQQAILEKIRDVYLPVNDATLPLKDNYREKDVTPPPTGIVRSWLNGREAYEYYEAYPSLTRYDELFGPAKTALAPEELRAAGLTAVRELLARRDALNGYEDLMRQMFRAREELVQLDLDIKRKENLAARAKTALDKRLQELKNDLDAEMAYRPAPALRMLRRITEEILVNDANAKKQIIAVEDRLQNYVSEQDDANSPLAEKTKQLPRQASYFPPLQLGIDSVAAAYDRLNGAVSNYTASRADSLIRSYSNLNTFETIFGIAQQVFFLLSTGNEWRPFVSNSQLADFQTDATARRLFAGLGRERLGRVPDLAASVGQRDSGGRDLGEGTFSSTGITDFLLDFGLYLADHKFIAKELIAKNKGMEPRTAQRIAAVDFITKTLSALIEAPLLNDHGVGISSLADKYPSFAEVPEVSRQLNQLFRLTRTGEYRYAMENLLELVKLFDIVPSASRREKKLMGRQRQLRKMLYDNIIEDEGQLKSIGMALPDADRLPLLGDNERDKTLLTAYREQLNQPGISALDREEAANSIRDLKTRRIQEELQRVQTRLKKLKPERTDRFRENLFRYGTFMADVAKANNPEQFENALNTIALPVGSSQIKRNKPSSVELAAYFGATLSRERLVLPVGISAPELEEEVFGASLFVPVGFSYSRNIGGNKSITLFGSLLDLGALTAFRLEGRDAAGNGATVERLPQFRPANVIAPGVHLMYNFPKSPFTLGFGVQDGPSVRKFTLSGQNVQRDARSVRAMLTFSIDVPIFRFFNR